MLFKGWGNKSVLPREKAFYADSITRNEGGKIVREYALFEYPGGKESIPHDWRPILAEIRDKITILLVRGQTT